MAGFKRLIALSSLCNIKRRIKAKYVLYNFITQQRLQKGQPSSQFVHFGSERTVGECVQLCDHFCEKKKSHWSVLLAARHVIQNIIMLISNKAKSINGKKVWLLKMFPVVRYKQPEGLQARWQLSTQITINMTQISSIQVLHALSCISLMNKYNSWIAEIVMEICPHIV